MDPLEVRQCLSSDLADFTGLGAISTIGDVAEWMNNYMIRNNLFNGEDQPGTRYPGPDIKLDENLNYLFGPYLQDMKIKEGVPIRYSQFKALCLKHMKQASDS